MVQILDVPTKCPDIADKMGVSCVSSLKVIQMSVKFDDKLVIKVMYKLDTYSGKFAARRNRKQEGPGIRFICCISYISTFFDYDVI